MDELSMLLMSGAGKAEIKAYIDKLMIEVEIAARADERCQIEKAVLNSMGMPHHRVTMKYALNAALRDTQVQLWVM